MAGRGKDEVRSELIKVLRSPKITHENGLLESSNDSLKGFVTELYNCEIDGGDVVRRKGSKCLDNPLVARRWHLLFNETIAGAEVCIGVDANGLVFAMSDLYPERAFKVNKTGFTKIIYKNPDKFATTPMLSYELKFERGSSFWHVPSADRFYIVNNYGDYFVIMKGGSIQFMKDSNVNHTYNSVYRLRECREGDMSIECGMYVDAFYTRKLYARPLFLCDAPFDEYVPIRGNIKTAPVDNEGRVGELSSPLFLPRYETKYVSMINCLNAADAKLYTPVERAWDRDGGTFVYKTDDKYVVSSSYHNYSPPTEAIQTRRARLIVQGSTPDTLRFYMFFDASFYDVRIDEGDITLPVDDFDTDDFNTKLETDPGFMFARYMRECEISGYASGTPSDTKIIESLSVISDGFNFLIKQKYSVTQIPFLYDVDITPVETLNVLGEFIPEKRIYSPAPAEGGVMPAQKYEGYLYELTVSDTTRDRLFLEINRQQNRSIDHTFDFGSKVVSNVLGVFGITIYVVCDKTDYIQQRFAPFAFSYSTSNVSGKLGGAGDLVSLKNKGFDCWDVRFLTIDDIGLQNNVTDVDLDTGEILVGTEFDVVCTKADYIDWLMYGSRFAVWNDGIVLGISQKVFFDFDTNSENYLKPVYQISDNRTIKTYDQDEPDAIVPFQIPQSQTICVGYMPVCALDFQGSRKFGYAGEGITFGFNNPKDIAVNNNMVYSIMGGNLSVGTLNEAFTFFAYYNYGKDLISIKPMLNGVVAFMKDDICYCTPDGTKSEISGVGSLKSRTVIKSFEQSRTVFAITEANEVIVISVAFADDGKPFVQCALISKAIEKKTWESNVDFAFCNSTLYVCSDNEIYGFFEGGWKKKYVFENKRIAKIAGYRNRLVVSFDDDIALKGRFTVIDVGDINL